MVYNFSRAWRNISSCQIESSGMAILYRQDGSNADFTLHLFVNKRVRYVVQVFLNIFCPSVCDDERCPSLSDLATLT